MQRVGWLSIAGGLAQAAVLVATGCTLPHAKTAAPFAAHASQAPVASLPAAQPPRAGETLLDSSAQPTSGDLGDNQSSVAPTVALGSHSEQADLAQPLEVLPPAVEADALAAPSSEETLAIDLPTALALAAGENPQVAFARQRVGEAFANLRAAEALWVPSLRAGLNYNKHEGTIQDVAGKMIETSRGSVYSGLGAQAVGAGSPAVPGLVMNFHTRDFIYQPRITQQVLAARRQASRAALNDTLMDAALAYNDLLESMELEAIAAQTRDNTLRLADLTGQYARTGQGLPADADRAQAELATRQVEAQRAVEQVQVSSVRLARTLSQDPTIRLAPTEPTIAPIELTPAGCSVQQLVATGLGNRPELAECRFLVDAAIEQLRREQNAPLIPSVLLGMSYGGNGGGLGGNIENYGDRMDFDAVAYWELRNLGYGEQAARAAAQANVEQARWRQVQVMDQTASEIAEAYVQVESRRRQMALAQSGIRAAQDSYRRNAQRIQDALGLPIEALQSIQALDNAQRQYTQTVADFNRAQFRLHRALGWPIQ
jgi:outer membrane protein TolC